jgi:DNA/RNA-binding domain of Phe-tRNA-synthetase-like protein
MIKPAIVIDESLKQANAGRLALGVLWASVKVTDYDHELWREIDQLIPDLAKLRVEQVTSLREIQALRATYKALGKDPSRYRGSNEALLRRVIQGKGLYKVNTVVDINNLVSLESRRSVASYDCGKLSHEIVFRRGQEGESYAAIGKGTLNVEGLPVFVDASGPFGSCTSDSKRAMITLQTGALMMVIVSFDGDANLDSQLMRATGLLEKYADAGDIRTEIVISI